MNNTTNEQKDHQIYEAETPADKRQQVLWFAMGKTREEILKIMASPSWDGWKSKTVLFRNRLFCAAFHYITIIFRRLKKTDIGLVEIVSN